MTLSYIINGIFRKLEQIVNVTHFRPLKTLYVNFRTLPFQQALKLPIFIYGKMTLYDLSGKVEIKGNISRGMIKFGKIQGFFAGQKGGAMLMISKDAKLVFNGPCKFDVDCAIRITSHGVVNIGAFIGFGSETKIYCEEQIIIGDFCRIPFGSCFMDTNYHYSIDTTNGMTRKKSKPIIIGRYNWVGNTSTIMKGTRTPEGTIIASKSFLNKDYTLLGNGENNIVLAGSPAKIVSYNHTRILNLDLERKLNEYFISNPDTDKFMDNKMLQQYIDTSAYTKVFR